MGIFNSIVYIALAVFLCWLLYRQIKNNPEMLSKANLNKSFFTMGILALCLIGFIGFIVVLLRS